LVKSLATLWRSGQLTSIFPTKSQLLHLSTACLTTLPQPFSNDASFPSPPLLSPHPGSSRRHLPRPRHQLPRQRHVLVWDGPVRGGKPAQQHQRHRRQQVLQGGRPYRVRPQGRLHDRSSVEYVLWEFQFLLLETVAPSRNSFFSFANHVRVEQHRRSAAASAPLSRASTAWMEGRSSGWRRILSTISARIAAARR